MLIQRSVLPFTGLLLSSLLAVSVPANAKPSTSFYAVAHADDWQLFMNPNPAKDMKIQDRKVVFIYTTAGDNGSGADEGNIVPYFIARERGGNNAMQFLADLGAIGVVGNSIKVTFNGHELERYSYKNTVSYFLRLPDGNIDGSGYPTTGSQSLANLFTGVVDQISSVDNSITFKGWSDLTETLSQLVKYEATGSVVVRINIPDTDPAINPNDHSDHIHTSLAMQNVIKKYPCIIGRYYVEYYSSTMPINLTEQDFGLDAATWGVTTSTLSNNRSLSTWVESHNAWLGRNYMRTAKGQGICSF